MTGAGVNAPLAELLRPRSVDDVVGQDHLLAPGQALRVALDAHQPHSCILWGPPGTGKTTLARLMAAAFDAECIAISAVLGGVKDIRDAVERASVAQAQGRRTLVFVDEVHRFNKAQQDAFLPHVESGLFTFIGATTENPSFEVNAALLSRAVVYVLHALDAKALQQILAKAQADRALPAIDSEAVELLVGYADGDARRLLNAAQTVALGARQRGADTVDAASVRALLGEQLRRFDAGGDAFYDTISALHKSVRGSDPDAALYWLVRMLDGGADPRYLARRLIRMASEDIGLADPRALALALDAAQAYERLGSPEGDLALAQCSVYLAVAPKSNAVYTAFKAARAWVQRDGTRPVPAHLRNAPTQLMKDLGHGSGYRYAHDEPDAFAAGERYLPDGMPVSRFYEPVERGLEIKIAAKLRDLRARNAQAGASR